ncbi:triphosphoribosyl-dephospho-CoA synthase CitG [Gluconobacter kondonii]|uniref:triphosphoribosyl-dephospho-CoA synthase CitG n=1 Tax=Gluconobacter kondonii TaxID=941463 RepID=UPI001980AB4D|nr:triphosphoribosyl-dephospho-CoA synthase CitG [Gluconobacter kondonii]MBN3868403.1 triphosphoribosyl-dephospho-CoA synthase CitG [Gluconobacter kondonii]
MITSEKISQIARSALLKEINLSPKPGLVDRFDNGAHSDMDHALFLESIDAISPFFSLFYESGCASTSSKEALNDLRKVGVKCENAMFSATNGVNTHKGGIFALGLLCGASGRLISNNHECTIENVCIEVSRICDGLLHNDLRSGNERCAPPTAGQLIYRQYGFGGARAEAESGFLTVQRYALPAYRDALCDGYSAVESELISLISLISNNNDTNVISRSGIYGLNYAKVFSKKALNTLREKGFRNFETEVSEMNTAFISRNISPGGSADLLSVMLFLVDFERYFLNGESVC